ncbi:MAG: hypothetical protein MUE75_10490 [Algoriphagus sp.]|nr:hypothetical protein [Algoriphagus sp.]
MEQDSLENLKSFLEAVMHQTLPSQEIIAPSPIANPANHPSLESSELDKVKEEVKAEPIPLKGNFTKGILILHEESELNTEVMDMLVKMINACGHSMNEVGLVSSEILENRSLEDFQALNAHVVLKFGRIKHPVNAVAASPYEIYSEEETEYLFADALTVIAEDKNLKRKLWSSLQVLFNLSTGTK